MLLMESAYPFVVEVRRNPPPYASQPYVAPWPDATEPGTADRLAVESQRWCACRPYPVPFTRPERGQFAVFGRRSREPETPAVDEAAKVGGKGRPTPRRSEAEAQRKKRMAPPRNRKEANAVHRQRSREQRAKQMEAMRSGDERYLPARDQGPVKRFIRDYVDAHRTIGELLIPIFVVIFVLVYIRTPWAAALGSVAWLVVLVAMALDSVRIVTGAKRALTAKFGKDEAKGNVMYILMRSWQMRRLRLPKPRVKAGAKI
jgi:Protein of unknown function (DUF3043)